MKTGLGNTKKKEKEKEAIIRIRIFFFDNPTEEDLVFRFDPGLSTVPEELQRLLDQIEDFYQASQNRKRSAIAYIDKFDALNVIPYKEIRRIYIDVEGINIYNPLLPFVRFQTTKP